MPLRAQPTHSQQRVTEASTLIVDKKSATIETTNKWAMLIEGTIIFVTNSELNVQIEQCKVSVLTCEANPHYVIGA